MGEPPLGASSSADRNDVLRRRYYWEAPRQHSRVCLGRPVAASACVPSLFDPGELIDLFPDRSVRLVDGGVYDNQGLAGLLEQECTMMLVSDASGQTSSSSYPSAEFLGVGLRANDILMARVRAGQFREIDLLRRSPALTGFAYLPLKKDLELHQVDWIACQDPYESLEDPLPTPRGQSLTRCGIPRTIQTALAGVRTDLDSFSNGEAHALMLSGYRMATTEFKKCLTRWPLSEARCESWQFLAIEGAVTRGVRTGTLARPSAPPHHGRGRSQLQGLHTSPEEFARDPRRANRALCLGR
jgi:hypothetical protein